MRLALAIITIMLVMLLTACVATNYYGQTVQSWIGGDAKRLRQSWGAPNQTLTTADGITYYVYTTEIHRRFPYPITPDAVIVANNSGQTIGFALPSNDPETYTVHCTTTFIIDKQNKIMSAEYHGGNCIANEAVKQEKSNPEGR